MKKLDSYLIANRGRLSKRTKLIICLQLCEAVASLEDLGLIHTGICPETISVLRFSPKAIDENEIKIEVRVFIIVSILDEFEFGLHPKETTIII